MTQFKKPVCWGLIVVILGTSPSPRGYRSSAEAQEATDDAPRAEAPRAPLNDRQALLRQIDDLREEAEALAEALIPSDGDNAEAPSEGEEADAPLTSAQWYRETLYEDYTAKLTQLREVVETALNAPALDWNQASDEFYVSELQYLLSQEVEMFRPLARHELVFYDPRMSDQTSLTLSEKEHVFLDYLEILENYKVLQYLRFQEEITGMPGPGAHELVAALRAYALRLNVVGKADFDQFMNRPLYTVIEEDGWFEVVGQLSADIKTEIEALLALTPSERQRPIWLKRVLLAGWTQHRVELESLWMADRFPRQNGSPNGSPHGLPRLPAACDHIFPTLVPFSVPILEREAWPLSQRALFEAHFYTELMEREDLEIPSFFNPEIAGTLIEAVPEWRLERASLPTLEDQSQMVQEFAQILESYENGISRFVLRWFLEAQADFPFTWGGTESAIKSVIGQKLAGSKKLIFLILAERLLIESGQSFFLSDRVKRHLLTSAVGQVEAYLSRAEVSEAVDQIYDIYVESRELESGWSQLQERRGETSQRVDNLIESTYEVVARVQEQEARLARLAAGETLSPIEDTPENFSRVALSLLLPLADESTNLESLQLMRRILVSDPSYDAQTIGRGEDGTYRAARYKYRQWLQGEASSVSESVREQIQALARVLRLDEYISLEDLMSDPELRRTHEDLQRSMLLLLFPMLQVEIDFSYQGEMSHASLLTHAIRLQSEGTPRDVVIDLFQRAIWQMMQMADYEIARFCQSDPASDEGLRFLWAHFFSMGGGRGGGLSPAFQRISDRLVEQMADPETGLQSAVGHGFLAIIALSLVGGPLSRLPRLPQWRWLPRLVRGQRLIPRVPASLLHLSHQFGMSAAPLAFYWFFEDAHRLFIEDERLVESMEHQAVARSPSPHTDLSTPTLDEALEAWMDSSDGESDGESDFLGNTLILDRPSLRVAQGVFLLFAPVMLAFLRGFAQSMGGFYQFRLRPLGAGVPRALMRLRIPTRFWTLRPGNEILALSHEQMTTAYVNAVDRTLSVSRLRGYIQRWLRILRSDLAAHEARWGTGQTWDATRQAIQASAHQVAVPRHHAARLYFVGREQMAEALIAERITLMTNTRLYERTLTVLEQTTATQLSQSGFSVALREEAGALMATFGAEAPPFLSEIHLPQAALQWATTSIEIHRFGTLWLGAWVGYGGPLARAAQQLQAYHFLSSTQRDLLYREAIMRVGLQRRAAGQSLENLQQEEFENALREILTQRHEF